MLAKRGVEFLKDISKFCVNYGGHDAVTKAVRIIGGGDGRCIAEFTVAKEHTNSYGILHSGCTATIIDNITTFALMTTDSHPGVTVNLYANYFKSAKEGEEIIVDAYVLKVDKQMAFIECVLKNKADGSIVVKGGQTKYVDFSNDFIYNIFINFFISFSNVKALLTKL